MNSLSLSLTSPATMRTLPESEAHITHIRYKRGKPYRVASSDGHVLSQGLWDTHDKRHAVFLS